MLYVGGLAAPLTINTSPERATSCPLRGTNFTTLSRIRSERPVFDPHEQLPAPRTFPTVAP